MFLVSVRWTSSSSYSTPVTSKDQHFQGNGFTARWWKLSALTLNNVTVWADGWILTVGVMWLTWVFSLKVRVAPWGPKGELEMSSRNASMGCITEQLYRTLTSVLPLWNKYLSALLQNKKCSPQCFKSQLFLCITSISPLITMNQQTSFLHNGTVL